MHYFLTSVFFLRYKGKGRPDAIMAEICWRAKNLFQDEYQRSSEPMQIENVKVVNQGTEEMEMFADFQDSDNDDVERYNDYHDFYDEN